MSVSYRSEPSAPDRVLSPRVDPASAPFASPATCLVRIALPEQGDEHNARELCERIRQLVKRQPGTFCFVHEGTGMVNARAGYANAFKELDRELSERTTEVVCVLPAPIPRMMVYTVATLAQRPWTIFRTRAEAELHLRARGYPPLEETPLAEGALHLRVLRPV